MKMMLWMNRNMEVLNNLLIVYILGFSSWSCENLWNYMRTFIHMAKRTSKEAIIWMDLSQKLCTCRFILFRKKFSQKISEIMLLLGCRQESEKFLYFGFKNYKFPINPTTLNALCLSVYLCYLRHLKSNSVTAYTNR